MIYTVYKITNLLNKKIYIGVHKTENANDSYLGSGTLIIRAKEKYGKENFVKEILFEFDNEDAAYEKEEELVDIDFISRPDTYNVILGGKNVGQKWKKGHLYVRNAVGNILYIKNNDPQYLSGEYKQVGSKRGLIRMIHNITGESKEFSTLLYEDLSEHGWSCWSSNFMRYKNDMNEEFYLKTDDPKIKELGLMPWTKNMKVMKRGDVIIHVNKKDVTDDMISIVKDTVTVKDKDGNNLRVSINDPRYMSGELVGVNKGKTGLFDHLNVKNCTCKYCGIVTTKGNISRWHNEKCKLKPQS